MLAPEKKGKGREGKPAHNANHSICQELSDRQIEEQLCTIPHYCHCLQQVGRGEGGKGGFACQRVAATGSAPSLASAVSHTKPSVALAAVSGAQKVDIGHPQPLFTCWLALKPLLLAISMCATKLLLIFSAELQQQRQGKKGGCPLILRRLATTAILFYALAIKLQFFGANLSKNI